MVELLFAVIRAVIVGAIGWLVCTFGGTILASTGLPLVTEVGNLLVSLAVPIGALVGLYWFFFRERPSLSLGG